MIEDMPHDELIMRSVGVDLPPVESRAYAETLEVRFEELCRQLVDAERRISYLEEWYRRTCTAERRMYMDLKEFINKTRDDD